MFGLRIAESQLSSISDSENQMSTKWVILDMMGVIFEVSDDVNDLLVPYIQKRNNLITAEKINEMYTEASLGRILSSGFWNELGFDSEYPEIERNYLDTCFRIDPEFTDVAEKLAKDYSLTILSNDVIEWSDYLRTKFDLNGLFKCIIVSGEVRYRKPNKKIYEILLDRIQSSPSDCIFVDDRFKNLIPASEMGIRTIRFAREQTRQRSFADNEIGSFTELPKAIEMLFK